VRIHLLIDVAFPPSKNGGPIEATAMRISRRFNPSFPPSKNGGPIEAAYIARSDIEIRYRFRRQKTAAPLKHVSL